MKIKIATALLFLWGCQAAPSLHIVQGEAQGTTYTVKYMAPAEIPHLKTRLDSLLSAIDSSLSTYVSHSLISDLNQGLSIKMDPLFLTVFRNSESITQETGGAFDPTIGPLIEGWGFGFSNPAQLDSAQVLELLSHCGFDNFQVDGSQVFRIDTSASINFNAIAQGLSVDLMAYIVEEEGLGDFYVELGGELMVRGSNPEGKDWRIGIDKPQGKNLDRALSHIVHLRDRAMATSGNYRKFYEYDGKRYSHTLDPKTGFPVQHQLLSATVVAYTAMDADAYATACMVMGLEQSMQFINGHSDLEALFIYEVEGELQAAHTPGLDSLLETL